MNKKKVDKYVIAYQKKLFGFAMEKLHKIDEAEELASDILFELYKSLMHAEHIANMDGYVYRIACNVWAKYLDKRNRHQHLNLLDIPYAITEEGYERVEEEEIYHRIRKEIGLLSERQRVILYLHYYQNMTVKDIAEKLHISSGTVKWHLSDAKSSLKEEMVMTKKDNLSVNPIKFISMGHGGSPGTTGATEAIFDTRLKQNIAWNCYWKAKTVEEIARDLEVPIVYIESELQKLVEWGYIDQMDKTKNPRFLTNMYITDVRNSYEDEDAIYRTAAHYLCENIYEKVFALFDKAEDNWGFTCPDNDKNFMKYSLVMLMTKNMRQGDIFPEEWEKYAVKRPDGGHFIAYASVSDDCNPVKENVESEEEKHWLCGYMFREVWEQEQMQWQILQCNCDYSDRDGGWADNMEEDWYHLKAYMDSGCDKNKIQPEQYQRLCEKGYIADETVQPLILKVKGNNLLEQMDQMIRKHMEIPEELWDYQKELDEKRFQKNRKYCPERMEGIVKWHNSALFSNGLIIPYIVEELLEKGLLQPLTERQKKAVFTVVVMKE